MARHQPNIIVTGTPGVGKTTHCERLAQETGLEHFSINRIVTERNCHDGWDEELQTYIVDEDKLLDAIEDEVKQGGYIIDWHACDLFPQSWIDLVVVLRTDTAKLYDRLRARRYPEGKLQENLDSEIMQVLFEEARGSYAEEIVVQLQSNEPEDMENNVDRIATWAKNWTRDHGQAATT